MKKIILSLLFVTASAVPATAQQATLLHSGGEEGLFLDMHRSGIGSVNEYEEKKKFFDMVKLEKQKLQDTMLDSITENAYKYYRSGNYEAARELAGKILSINSEHEDAKTLFEATSQLRNTGSFSLEKERNMLKERFNTSLALYREGRIVESYKKMYEVVKLSPSNIKARYWFNKMREDLCQYYYDKGLELYEARDLKGSLENLYASLMIKPQNPANIEWITKIEEELRQQKSNQQLKQALDDYSKGKILAAYKGLQKALEIQPGDSKSSRLLAEVKGEIENGYIENGKKLYGARKYTSAIGEWNKARPYSVNPDYLNQLVARAKQQMKREAEEKKRRAEIAERRRKAEAARRAKEAEERKKAEEEAAQKGISVDELEQKPAVSAENKAQAQQHYIEGLKFFQNSNYEQARNSWTIARQLDPENEDAKLGLKRIEQIISAQ
ncbi:MAG: hypothetical protein J6Z08_05005 [Elusimicrobiales bacterium]|jgi:Tfp pilus assembly protein PilF|nr:hypothetical protein [Elusimicrobiales bacterium]